jgi:hypothetical protein
MRKNKMMRLASCLLVLTLLTTSVISGTFAKYTTTGSINDTARVAKWGVVITGSGSLYGTQYLYNGVESNANRPIVSVENEQNLSVKSIDSIDVVAPGTKSSTAGLSFSISGTPEVRTKVKVTVTAQDIYLAAGTYAVMQKAMVKDTTFATKVDAGLYTYDVNTSTYSKVASSATFASTTEYYELTGKVTVAEGGYYPITYENSNTDIAGTKITKIAAQIATYVKKLEKGEVSESPATEKSVAKATYEAERTLDPNTDLGKTLNLGTITWEWAYEDSKDGNKDLEDTILGDLMALNGAFTGSPVVVKVSKTTTDDDTIAVLKVDSEGIVSYETKETKTETVGGEEKGTVVTTEHETGSIKTSFEITLTATQDHKEPETTTATTEESSAEATQ